MELPSSSDLYKLSVAEFDTNKLLAHAAQQRDRYGFNDTLIIDVDSHHYETESMGEIIEFIENPILRQLALSARQTSFRGGLTGSGVGYQDMGGRVTRYPLRKLEQTPKDSVHRDIHLSLKWMDACGVDITCMFPTPMLGLGLHPQPEVEAAMARAYNRWLVERVLPGNNRVRSMLYLPMNDHVAAYNIVKDFGAAKGVIGFMITTPRHKPLYDNDFMKMYSLIEEQGHPIGFHSGFNWDDPLFRTANRFIAVHALGFTWHNVVHCTNWIVNAMPERFPKLKVIWIESGIAWIPWLGQRLDNEYMMRSNECPGLKKRPSDYMREDFFYTNQPMEKVDMEMLEATFKYMNAETQLLYASDYPHWDMDLPSAVWDIPFLSEQGKRNILGGNAKKLLKLDTSGLRSARAAE